MFSNEVKSLKKAGAVVAKPIKTIKLCNRHRLKKNRKDIHKIETPSPQIL